MTASEILDGIFKKQADIGLTNQQFSDASGVPKATIERIKRGDTTNPTMQTILDLAAAVGYSFGNHPEQIPPVPDANTIRDPMIAHMITVYENRGENYEARIKRITAHFNMLLAEKNRWLKFSLALNIILVLFLCGLLIYDFTHLDRGWIQEIMSRFDSYGSVNNAVMAVRDWFANLCSV